MFVCDISDNQSFKSELFFIEHPDCLKLILYHGGFFSIPSALLRKNIVVAVCLSVANVPVAVWYKTDHMSAVLLCGENDLKHFGHAHILCDVTGFERFGRKYHDNRWGNKSTSY